MNNTSAYECQDCGVALVAPVGQCDECGAVAKARWQRLQAERRPYLARKPQNFDTSPLPLFGDGHKQRELF